jgi:5'(3')-deoxyribonucleotidase
MEHSPSSKCWFIFKRAKRVLELPSRFGFSSLLKLSDSSAILKVPAKTGLEVKIKILYIDIDNVLVDFKSGIDRLDEQTKELFADRLDEVPGIFSLMDPMPGAIAAYRELSNKYDTYILSTAPWLNASAWSDKIQWVQEHLGSQEGEPAYKRLILSHHKNLNMGDYLIDDRTANGVEKFTGEHIHFGTEQYPDWDAVLRYLG